MILMIFPTILRQKYFWESKLIVKILCPIILRMISFLLANDRKPYETEKCVFLYYGKMMIGIRKEEENSVKYYGIRNRNAIINESDIDELMGYIVETTTV